MEESLSLWDYYVILRRRRWVILASVLLFGLIGFGLALLRAPEPIYEAKAIVRFQKAFFPQQLWQQLLLSDPFQDLASQTILIESQPILEQVARRLSWATSPYELWIDAQMGEGGVLIIAARHSDPLKAAELANTTAEVYRDYVRKTRHGQLKKAAQFVREKISEVRERLRTIERTLFDLEQRYPDLLLTPKDEASKLQETLRQLSDQRNRLQADLRALEHDFEGLLTPPDAKLAPLYNRLNQLQLELAEKRQVMAEAHPEIQRLLLKRAQLVEVLRNTLSSQILALEREMEHLHHVLQTRQRRWQNASKVRLNHLHLQQELETTQALLQFLQEQFHQLLISEQQLPQEVEILQPALPPTMPIETPRIGAKTLLGLIVGGIVGVLMALLIETLDTSITAAQELEALLKVPVLGLIPRCRVLEQLESIEDLGRCSLDFFEAFRLLRIALLRRYPDLKVLMVTSALPGEGKSITTLLLGWALASFGKRILIIDADPYSTPMTRELGLEDHPGWSELLTGQAKLKEVVQPLPKWPFLEWHGPPITIIPSGKAPQGLAEYVNQNLATLFAQLKAQFDMILIDTPPLFGRVDATMISAHAEGTLLVVRFGVLTRTLLRQLEQQLDRAHIHLIGTCLVGVSEEFGFYPSYDGQAGTS